MIDYTVLPDNLPVPTDDGAADHLPGMPVPALRLATSDGGNLDLAALGTRPNSCNDCACHSR